MSASENNMARQKRRHRGPLIGMALAVVAVLIAFFFFLTGEVDEGTPPEGSSTTIDGRTGQPQPEN